MQSSFALAGLRRGRQLGPRQIDFEKVIGEIEAATFAAVEQMVT